MVKPKHEILQIIRGAVCMLSGSTLTYQGSVQMIGKIEYIIGGQPISDEPVYKMLGSDYYIKESDVTPI